MSSPAIPWPKSRDCGCAAIPSTWNISIFSSLSIYARDPIVVVVVFFTLTNRASTIPSNIRGCQSGTWSQRGTKVNGSHHGDNPLLGPTGIQIATNSYATLQAMAPTNNIVSYVRYQIPSPTTFPKHLNARHARRQGNINFPCLADHEQDWQPYPVDPYSAICDDHTYIHTYIHILGRACNATPTVLSTVYGYSNTRRPASLLESYPAASSQTSNNALIARPSPLTSISILANRAC